MSHFPGVFVITHIRTCRNGAGYCILGFSCEVDKDFIKDDLGGHCNGLGAAFNPKASFICCRENPAFHSPPVTLPSFDLLTSSSTTSPGADQDKPEEIVIENDAIVTETSVATEIVTETYTEIIEPLTEVVMLTTVEEVTTEEILRPGIVEDIINDNEIGSEEAPAPAYRNEPDVVAQAEQEPAQDGTETTQSRDEQTPPKEQPQFVLLSSSENEALNEAIETEAMEEGAKVDMLDKDEDIQETMDKAEIEEVPIQDLISTSPSDLKPDRDDPFGSILASTPSSLRVSATNNAGSILVQGSTEMEEELEVTENVPDFAILDSNSAIEVDKVEPRLEDQTDEVSLKAELRTESVRTSPQCGRLGGAAVLQAFGRAADDLLPDLVFSWITGGQGNQVDKMLQLYTNSCSCFFLSCR